MKINCDMGESFGPWPMGNDPAVMPFIDMANIACGMHASDPTIMLQTVALAKKHGVSIGAHIGYADLQGFGRRDIAYNKQELLALCLYQLGALDAICHSVGTTLDYVKPHGALYNRMMKDEQTLEVIMAALAAFKPELPLMIMAAPEHQHYQQLADQHGLSLIHEAFVDRAYSSDGRLEARQNSGAVYHQLDAIEQQARQLIEQHSVTTLAGNKLAVKADCLCLHGDGELAVDTARLLRNLLSNTGGACD